MCLLCYFSLAKAAGGGAVLRVVGVLRSMGNAEHRQTATPYGMASVTLPSP